MLLKLKEMFLECVELVVRLIILLVFIVPIFIFTVYFSAKLIKNLS